MQRQSVVFIRSVFSQKKIESVNPITKIIFLVEKESLKLRFMILNIHENSSGKSKMKISE